MPAIVDPFILFALAIGVAGTAAAVLVAPMNRRAMRILYGPLVDRLVGGDPRCVVEQPTATSIVLRLATEDGTTVFVLEQTLTQLNVRWTNHSPMTGTRERAWTFFKFRSQDAVMDRVHDDLLAEHRRMMRS